MFWEYGMGFVLYLFLIFLFKNSVTLLNRFNVHVQASAAGHDYGRVKHGSV